mgnify:FL=1|tara:strand:+ start:99 stop:581 length:483 start_codon:yes stop_codon:yes gene_type:complete
MPKKKTISEIREKPGMSNAGKYKGVKSDDFAGPNGTYPINTLKRAKSAIKLSHFASNPGSIVKNVLKKYPQLKEEKKNPITYGMSPIKFTGDKDSLSLKAQYDKYNKREGFKTEKEVDKFIRKTERLIKVADKQNNRKMYSKFVSLNDVLHDVKINDFDN